MRLDAAVQQFTTALDKEETMVLEGHKALWIILNLVKDISDFLVGPQTRAISFLSLGIIAMNIAHVWFSHFAEWTFADRSSLGAWTASMWQLVIQLLVESPSKRWKSNVITIVCWISLVYPFCVLHDISNVIIFSQVAFSKGQPVNMVMATANRLWDWAVDWAGDLAWYGFVQKWCIRCILYKSSFFSNVLRPFGGYSQFSDTPNHVFGIGKLLYCRVSRLRVDGHTIHGHRIVYAFQCTDWKYMISTYMWNMWRVYIKTLNRREIAQGVFNPSLSSNVSTPFAEKIWCNPCALWIPLVQPQTHWVVLVLVFCVSHLTVSPCHSPC